jgi:hypothetical protein
LRNASKIKPRREKRLKRLSAEEFSMSSVVVEQWASCLRHHLDSDDIASEFDYSDVDTKTENNRSKSGTDLNKSLDALCENVQKVIGQNKVLEMDSRGKGFPSDKSASLEQLNRDVNDVFKAFLISDSSLGSLPSRMSVLLSEFSELKSISTSSISSTAFPSTSSALSPSGTSHSSQSEGDSKKILQSYDTRQILRELTQLLTLLTHMEKLLNIIIPSTEGEIRFVFSKTATQFLADWWGSLFKPLLLLSRALPGMNSPIANAEEIKTPENDKEATVERSNQRRKVALLNVVHKILNCSCNVMIASVSAEKNMQEYVHATRLLLSDWIKDMTISTESAGILLSNKALDSVLLELFRKRLEVYVYKI